MSWIDGVLCAVTVEPFRALPQRRPFVALSGAKTVAGKLIGLLTWSDGEN